MGRSKRALLKVTEETSTPPTSLPATCLIAKVVKAEGSNLWKVELPGTARSLLVELPIRFRSEVWLKRGGYVLVDRAAFQDRGNKLEGEIVNIVRDEKRWRKEPYWYLSFVLCQEFIDHP